MFFAMTFDASAAWVARGPVGVTSHALAIDPADPATVYAGTDGRGLFKSFDHGVTWHVLAGGLAGTQVYAVAIDPRAHSRVYAMTNDGLWTSGDSGASWTLLSSSYSDIAGALFVDPTSSAVYAAGRPFTLVRSSDHGSTWSSLAAGLPADQSVNDVVSDDATQTILVAMSASLQRSRDLGRSWQQAEDGLPAEQDGTSPVTSLALVRGNDSGSEVVYAGTRSWDVYRSDDGADLWQVTGEIGTPGESSPVTRLAASRDGSYVYALSNVLGLFRSTDEGLTWSGAQDGIGWSGTTQVIEFALDPAAGLHLFAAATDGLYESFDGGASWIARSSLPGMSDVTSVATSAAAPGVVLAASDGNVVRSADGGHTWTALLFGSFFAVAVDPEDADHLLAGTTTAAADAPQFASAAILESDDGGGSWTHSWDGAVGSSVRQLALAGDHAYAATTAGIVFSNDSGKTWSGPSAPAAGIDVASVAIDAVDASRAWGAAGSILLRTVNGGSTWQRLSAPASINVLLSKGGHLWGGGPSGIYRSEDGGLTWAHPCSTTSPVAALAVGNGALFAALQSGDVIAGDGTPYWINLPRAAGTISPTSLAFDSGTGTLFLGTMDAGVFAGTFGRQRAARH